MSGALTQWASVQQALDALRTEPGGSAAFARLVRDQQLLRQTLPPRFDEVLLSLLDRLESSALFSEESCSFSQRDLLDSLQLWLDKARERLAASPS